MSSFFTDAEAPIDLAAQIKCVEREIAMRERVYPRWISTGKTTPDKSAREIATMRAVLATLRQVATETPT